jgi:hypothetical protein
LTALVQFSGISSFSFVLFSYVSLTSLCINVFAFCTFCITVTHSVFCTTYVRVVYVLFVVYVTLPPGIGPIPVGIKYVYIIYIYIKVYKTLINVRFYTYVLKDEHARIITFGVYFGASSINISHS